MSCGGWLQKQSIDSICLLGNISGLLLLFIPPVSIGNECERLSCSWFLLKLYDMKLRSIRYSFEFLCGFLSLSAAVVSRWFEWVQVLRHVFVCVCETGCVQVITLCPYIGQTKFNVVHPIHTNCEAVSTEYCAFSPADSPKAYFSVG